LNLQNPYELVDSDNGYTFETEYGQIYSLSFLFYSLISNSKNYRVYTFNLEPINSVKPVIDNRIEITIQFALKKFFEKKVNALIVVFDSCDGRHQARARLFERWYRNSNVQNIHKIDATGVIDDTEILTSLFLETSNPYYDEIKASFAELENLNFYY